MKKWKKMICCSIKNKTFKFVQEDIFVYPYQTWSFFIVLEVTAHGPNEDSYEDPFTPEDCEWESEFV